MASSKAWFVYILRCCDDSLYTGITTDPEARLKAHSEGQGAKYTRSRRPVERVYLELCTGYSAALKREYAIKQLTRQEKLELINSNTPCGF